MKSKNNVDVEDPTAMESSGFCASEDGRRWIAIRRNRCNAILDRARVDVSVAIRGFTTAIFDVVIVFCFMGFRAYLFTTMKLVPEEVLALQTGK